jgi:hypothetical protein
VQRTEPFGDDAVETTYLRYPGFVHSSDFSQRLDLGQPPGLTNGGASVAIAPNEIGRSASRPHTTFRSLTVDTAFRRVRKWRAMHLLLWCGAAWLGRYLRRRDIIAGTMGGVLADTKAKTALIARNQALDAAVNTLPDWPDFLFEIESNALKSQFDMGRIDVRAVADPHGFGPEAKARGLAGEDAWNHIDA